MTAKFQLVLLTACLLLATLARSEEAVVAADAKPAETAATATITSLTITATAHVLTAAAAAATYRLHLSEARRSSSRWSKG